MHVYEVLAQCFVRESVTCCFALLGDANMNWATSLEGAGCELVYVRHEHCAVSAAMSWARTKNLVGVATVTCGPGLTQIITALPAAVRARIPLIIFAGEAPLKSPWYNQAIAQAPLIEATGAAYHSLHHVSALQQQVRDAFLQAEIEQRPVVIGVPVDLQNQPFDQSSGPWPVPSIELLPQQHPQCANSVDLERAVRQIIKAKKIIIMAGRGAVLAKAGPACRELAILVDGLLATTLPARGLFHDDPYYLGIVGGFSSEVTRECVQQADLVIAVGASLAQHNTDAGKLFDASKTLHIDLYPVSVSQGRVAANAHLPGDARLNVEALIAIVKNSHNRQAEWRTQELAVKLKTAIPDSTVFAVESELLDPRTVVAQLDAVLPLDWHMVNSSGHSSYFFSHMHRRPVERFHTIRDFGAIGNGLSYAIGVAVAHPDDTVVLFDGDGSLLMHIQELETVSRYTMNLLICVMNDGAYGSEIHKLRANGLSDQGAVFGRPEFANIAKGFELHGVHFNRLDNLKTHLAEFEQSGNATIWDFHVSDKVVSPVIRRAHTQV